MKKLLLAALLAMSFHASAGQLHPDGSMTFSKAEIEEIDQMLQQIEKEYFAAHSAMVESQDLADELQRKLGALKKDKCL
jgi:septal ring factor EnvC (AmiA/AmiB activator)